MFGVVFVVPPEVLVLFTPKRLVLAVVPVLPGGLKKDMVVVEDEVSRTDALCSQDQQYNVAVCHGHGPSNDHQVYAPIRCRWSK